MERDLTLFPNDALGNELWQRNIAGENLSQERDVEFSVIFPSQALALKFGHLLLENNQKLSFCSYPDNQDFSWEITAYPFIALTYANIIAYQSLLISSAEALNGKFDGWFCKKITG